MRRKIACTIVAAALLAPAASVRAQQEGAGPSPRLADACHQDYQTLCAGVQPGGGRILVCFRQHRDQLSAECVAALRAMRQARNPGG